MQEFDSNFTYKQDFTSCHPDTTSLAKGLEHSSKPSSCLQLCARGTMTKISEASMKG